jgi:hypothetical protein
MRVPPHSIWFVAGGCVASLAILATLLFLVPATVPPPPVKIVSIDWQLEQQPAEGGVPEFSELWINQSGPFWGFPFDLPAQGTFNDTVVIVNDEDNAVAICSVSIEPPLYIVSTYPPISPGHPMVAVASEDSLLTLTLGVHADSGAVVNGTGTISGLGCTIP